MVVHIIKIEDFLVIVAPMGQILHYVFDVISFCKFSIILIMLYAGFQDVCTNL